MKFTEKYIILVTSENYCKDLHCVINGDKNLYIANFKSDFYPDMIIRESSHGTFYAELANYILNCGNIYTLVPGEKKQIQILKTYIRIGQITRRLLRQNYVLK